jgi:hypothetical protein
MTEDERSEFLLAALEKIESAQEILDDGGDWMLVRDDLAAARDFIREAVGLPSEYLTELVRQHRHLTLVWPAPEIDDGIPF